MSKPLQIIIQILLALLILILGMLIGAWIGGNYATDVQFNGVRGYEATSQIGLLCSITIIIIWGLYHYLKKK